MPTALAAIGTRLCGVMPGLELNSSKMKLPSSRSIASMRPQPRAPIAAKAASQAERTFCVTVSSNCAGHSYFTTSPKYLFW